MEPTNQLATRSRLHGYLDGIGSLLTDKRQRASFALYAVGLLNEGERVVARALDPDYAAGDQRDGDPAPLVDPAARAGNTGGSTGDGR